MKRTLLCLLIIAVLIGVSACGTKGPAPETDVPAEETVTVGSPTEPSADETETTETKTPSVIGEHVHTVVIDHGFPASCTTSGLTEGKHCATCHEVLVEQKTIGAKGHKEVTDPAILPTCTHAGLTRGSHCSVCGLVILNRTPVPAKGHTVVTIPGKEATCTKDGLADGQKCSVCGLIVKERQVIPAGHKSETIPAVAATCQSTGLTAGKKCSVCGTILEAQTVVPVQDHFFPSKGNAINCTKPVGTVISGTLETSGSYMTVSVSSITLKSGKRAGTVTLTALITNTGAAAIYGGMDFCLLCTDNVTCRDCGTPSDPIIEPSDVSAPVLGPGETGICTIVFKDVPCGNYLITT